MKNNMKNKEIIEDIDNTRCTIATLMSSIDEYLKSLRPGDYIDIRLFGALDSYLKGLSVLENLDSCEHNLIDKSIKPS